MQKLKFGTLGANQTNLIRSTLGLFWIPKSFPSIKNGERGAILACQYKMTLSLAKGLGRVELSHEATRTDSKWSDLAECRYQSEALIIDKYKQSSALRRGLSFSVFFYTRAVAASCNGEAWLKLWIKTTVESYWVEKFWALSCFKALKMLLGPILGNLPPNPLFQILYWHWSILTVKCHTFDWPTFSMANQLLIFFWWWPFHKIEFSVGLALSLPIQRAKSHGETIFDLCQKGSILLREKESLFVIWDGFQRRKEKWKP